MPRRQRPKNETAGAVEQELRIIGGKWRATKLAYHGDPVTRPMKHRVREAIFNLVGPAVEGKHAVDCFAGTGALGLEALSRGAVSALFIERHIPTAAIVKQNIASVNAEKLTEVKTTSAFLWAKRDLAKAEGGGGKAELVGASPSSAFPLPPSALPWLTFVSPPYDFFIERQDEMLELIATVRGHAPAGSITVVEADQRFDFALLPGGLRENRGAEGWDVREYAPAVVGVWRDPA